MRFTVPHATLLNALTYVAKTAPKNPPVAVLCGVVINATGTGVTLAAFDWEQSRRYTATDVADVTPGRVVVSAHRLHAIVKDLPKGKNAQPVTLREDGTDVVVTCGRASFTVPTMPAEDYPALPDMPATVGAVEVSRFAAVVRAVAASAGRDETLPMMTGIRFEADAGTLMVMSTDRYRLHMWDTPWTGDAFTGLVPAGTLADAVARAAKVKAGEFTLAFTDDGSFQGVFGFTCGPYAYTSRLLDGGNYPPVRSLFPKAWTYEVDVSAVDLVDAVKRASNAAERTTPVLLTLSPGTTLVEAGGADEARVSEPVDCEFRVTGDDNREAAITAMCRQQVESVKNARDALRSAQHAKQPDSAVDWERSRVVEAEERLAKAQYEAGESFDRRRAGGVTVRFEPAYLADAVVHTGAKRVRLCVVDPFKPAIVVPLTDGGHMVDGVRHLVMSIRVSGGEPKPAPAPTMAGTGTGTPAGEVASEVKPTPDAATEVPADGCGHADGESGCEAERCNRVPFGVPLKVRETAVPNPSVAETGVAELGRMLTEAFRQRLGTDDVEWARYLDNGSYDRKGVRSVAAWEFRAVLCKVRLLSYEARTPLGPEFRGALYVDGLPVGDFVPMNRRNDLIALDVANRAEASIERAGVRDTPQRWELRFKRLAHMIAIEHRMAHHDGPAVECVPCVSKLVGKVDGRGHLWSNDGIVLPCLHCGRPRNAAGGDVDCQGAPDVDPDVVNAPEWRLAAQLAAEARTRAADVDVPRSPGYPSVAKVPVLPDGYAERVERLRPFLQNGPQFSRGASEGVMYAVMKLETGGDWTLDMVEAEVSAGLRDRADVGRARRGEPLGPIVDGPGDVPAADVRPVVADVGESPNVDVEAPAVDADADASDPLVVDGVDALRELGLPAHVLGAAVDALRQAAAKHTDVMPELTHTASDVAAAGGVRAFPIPVGTAVRRTVSVVRESLGDGYRAEAVRTGPGAPNEVRVSGPDGADWERVAAVVASAAAGVALV